MLNVIVHGNSTQRPTLLIVHGLFGSARNWSAIARRMAEDRRVLTVDMRNHGESFRADTNTYLDMAADLADIVAAHGAPVDVLGHSMGGKAAMVFALTRPQQVNRLLVADISPVSYGHSQAPLARIMMDLDLTGVTSRSEADRRLTPSVADAGTRAFLLQSLDLKGEHPTWRLNLEILERDMPLIMSFPQIAAVYDGPTLILTGADSDYVKSEHRPEIRHLFPKAKFAKIPGAGHWLHADKPTEFVAALRVFFN